MQHQSNVSPFRLGQTFLVVFFRGDYGGKLVEAEYLMVSDKSGEEGADEAIDRAKRKFEYDHNRSAANFSVKVTTLHHQDAFGCLYARGPKYPINFR